uniref:Zinc finger protein 644a n=1 Tax=Seriola lalandi dorsalis TaxID=1841481 RepID=A0A3B4YD04_SERLL
MAAEMSCLTGVDEDDKDADPEINALSLLQEPVRMAQGSASCTDSFGKPSLKQNSVLDVMSNTDMLSPVGLGNGPSSHQATQAHELNSISTDKEEEKSITPLKTVQEIDTAGIWGFDVDSPENSLDNFSSASDLHWDPHKEFMQFLWENHGDSPGEEPKEEVPPSNSQRRRKRKMDMVVMVDPSEDLYPDLSRKSSEELSDTEGPEDSIPVRKVRKSRKFPKSQSSPTGKVSKYPNGTVKAIKEILYNAPARNSHENSIGHGLSPLKGRLTINSHSEEKLSRYPCSKCKLIFKKEHHLHRHMKSHVDPPNISPKPFICRECGQSFRQSGSLIEHMSIHQEKRTRLTEEVKSINDKKKEDKNMKLFCPQCPFGTNCPNTFVQHAKTHEKDKRRFRCDKCSFRTLSENDLRRHNIMQHTRREKNVQIQNDDSETFSCNICSYRAFSKHVFENHLLRRHQQTFEEYEAAHCSDKNAQPSRDQHVPTCKIPVEDAEFTSKISIKNQISSRRACSPSDSNDISDLFKNSKIKRGLKSQLTESKHGKKTTEQKKESNNCSTSVQNSKSDKDGSDQLLFEKIKTEEQEQTDPEIKEECIETEVFQETFDSHQIPLRESLEDDLSELESDRKNCPYCPAVFESGVGLSNHVRGHLHRVGLSYNARHVVPPEQVASQDRRPRIRRKISAFRRLKKGTSMESDSETVKSIHSCPLCGDSFDNRTGQSNHIRGHLKKLGKSFSTKNKSPLFLLRELMRDKKEFQRALQILGKRRNHFQYGASPKLSNADRFTPPPIGIPKSNSIPRVCTDAKPLISTFSLAEMEPEKRQLETKLDVKNSLSGTTSCKLKKSKFCLLAFDCKARRQRSRPGSKKKTLPLPQTPEEMYRLTCRFCDLVFQGPLSVQEDWIKHLQRHIMNTSVPHTGLGMVEVTSLPTDPPPIKTDQDSSLTATHAAS